MQSTRSAILGLAVLAAAGAAVAPAASNVKAEAEARAASARPAEPAKQQPARIVHVADATTDLRWRRLRRTPRWSFRGLRDKPWGGSVKKHARAMAQKRRAAR